MPRVGPFWRRVQHISRELPALLDAQGTFVANNNVVSQSVAHLHVHVVPRRRGDGLRGFFWPRTKYAEGQAESWHVGYESVSAGSPIREPMARKAQMA